MAKKVKKLVYIFIFILLPLTGFATIETGGVENIFSYGTGLRAIGMGDAFIAMDNDATLAYWNPGSMPFNQYKEISLFGTRTIANTYYFSGFYTNPSISFGTLSIGFMGLYTDGIESYDENASPITTAQTDYIHYQFLVSYGYNFNFGLGIGTTAKVEQIRITDYKGTGASFDIGMYYNPPKIQWLSIAAVVQDVYGTGIKIFDEYEENTRIYKAGLSTNFLLGNKKKTRLSFALDSKIYTDNYNPGTKKLLYGLNFGSELSFFDKIMLRFGYKNFTIDSVFKELPQGISAGFGIKQWGFGIDYALSFEDPIWQGTAELLMRVGINYRFGKSIDEKKEQQAKVIKEKIDEGIRTATDVYEGKLSKLSEDYKKDKEKIILEMDEKYKKKLEGLDEIIEERRQQIISDMTALFEAEKRRSIEELANQYESKRSILERQLIQERLNYEDNIKSIQKRFEEEKITIKKQLEADESFKSEHYTKGLQLFSDGKYEEALTEFETVARYDSNYLKVQEYINRTKAEMRDVGTYNPEILTIYYKGIDLFVQKKYKEAIGEWMKILEMDPYNKLAIRNIKEAENRLRKLNELGIK